MARREALLGPGAIAGSSPYVRL